MSELFKEMYDPYAEMHNFYALDTPSEDDQFRFVEAMEFLIGSSTSPVDKIAFSFDLAMYYRDIKNFPLEKKYLEIGAELGGASSKEQLGLLWYYGLCGEQNYAKAFHYFEESGTRLSYCMLADMYRFGYYVDKNTVRCRALLEDLFLSVRAERTDDRFAESTRFPEIALRLVQLNLENRRGTEFEFDCLFDARAILTVRQKQRPFWGNIRTMREILETNAILIRYDQSVIDLYDLLLLKAKNAVITFSFEDTSRVLEIFENEDEIVYRFDGKLFHGAEDFLERARIDGHRITSVLDKIENIHYRSVTDRA